MQFVLFLILILTLTLNLYIRFVTNYFLANGDEIIPSLQSSASELYRNGIDIPPSRIRNEAKPKGFRKIFSRKRSTTSLSGLSDSFSRGGLRATSGPRLGFNTNNEKRFQKYFFLSKNL